MYNESAAPRFSIRYLKAIDIIGTVAVVKHNRTGLLEATLRPAKNSSNSCYEMQVATPYSFQSRETGNFNERIRPLRLRGAMNK
jgi:hypothetical protein